MVWHLFGTRAVPTVARAQRRPPPGLLPRAWVTAKHGPAEQAACWAALAGVFEGSWLCFTMHEGCDPLPPPLRSGMV